MIPKNINPEQLAADVEAVVREAVELAKEAYPRRVWWSSDDGYLIGREGITINDISADMRYGDPVTERNPVLITWMDLVKPDEALARWKALYEADKLEQERLSGDWERKQYERLKAKFEKP